MLDSLTLFQQLILIFIFLANIISLTLFYIDKKRARNHKSRISEKTLLTSAFLLGGIGAWFGMNQFRHKTKHTVFKISVPLAAVITLGALVILLFN